MASILAFALGYSVPVTGTLATVLHLWAKPFPVTAYGWQGLVDPLLLLFVSASLAPKRSQWPIRLMKGSVSVICFFVAWGQLKEHPWLSTDALTEYLRASPFAKISSSIEGFVPLVEIFGGLAWLGTLMAPVLLWNRKLGKYLALILIAVYGLLAIFMPPDFSNWIMVVLPLLFLPDEWMTLDREKWKAQWPALRYAGRAGCFFLVMAVMLSTIFDRNIVQQFDLDSKIRSRFIRESYGIVARPFVKIGNLILFNSIWKMYSPVWRHVVWIDWYYTKLDGTVETWTQPNFSPDYRMRRRTWLQALWTDFKKEKVFIGMLSGDAEKEAYGKFLCHEILLQTGIAPLSVHPEISSFDIRGPAENWSLKEQAAERKDPGNEISCD